MALKGDRYIGETKIDLVCNDVVEQGQVLVYKTAGSGTALDTRGVCALVSNPSGFIPAGLSLANFENIDQTKQHRNWHKINQVVGEPAPLLRKGWVTTNKIIGTPTLGATAYLSSSGNVTPTLHATGGLVATPKVGMFESILDEDGYAMLTVALPIV